MMYMTYLYLYGSRLERHELRSDLRSAQSYHASDGLLTPETLVHRAVEMRVGTLAITDHDTTAAIPAAREEISRCGLALNLIPGVEISTVWENHEIHIVGLNIDIAHPAMRDFLAQQTHRRQARGRLIAERLEKAIFPARGKGH